MSQINAIYQEVETETDPLQDWKEWDAEIQMIERLILLQPRVENWLSELSSAGADRKTLLRFLALSVTGTSNSSTELMKEKCNRLTLLQRNLEAAATLLEETFLDVTGLSDFWIYLLSGAAEFQPIEARQKLPESIVAKMRQFAKAVGVEERKLRKLSQSYPRYARNRSRLALMQHIQEKTNKFNDELLADLLQAAHQAVGSSEEFSGEALRKFRQRHARVLLRPRRATEVNGTNQA